MRNSKNNTRLWIFGALALAVVGLVLALSTVFSSSNASAIASEADSNPQSAMAPSDVKTADADSTNPEAEPVEVTVSDGTISMPQTVSADSASSSATFKVTNEGQQQHSFAISTALSAPAEARLDGTLEAGQSETLTIELLPGTYIAYCPVEGHQAQERTDLAVEQRSTMEQ